MIVHTPRVHTGTESILDTLGDVSRFCLVDLIYCPIYASLLLLRLIIDISRVNDTTPNKFADLHIFRLENSSLRYRRNCKHHMILSMTSVEGA